MTTEPTVPADIPPVPPALLAILDRAAGREHSTTGSVAQCLAEILAAHKQMIRSETSGGGEGMREAVAGALHEAHREWLRPGSDAGQRPLMDAGADAVLAVRDGEMERLRAKVARLTSDLAETAGLEETAADRYQNALHWQERAEEAEAKLTAVDAELDRIANLSTVTADDGRADKFATGARWTLRMILTALAAPHGPAGQGDGGGH